MASPIRERNGTAMAVLHLTLSRSWTVDAATAVALGSAVLLVLASGASIAGPPWWNLSAVMAVYAGFAVFIFSGLNRLAPRPVFGLADLVTLSRGLLACLLAGFLAMPGGVAPWAWVLLGLAGLALALDGVDGWVARRCRRVTRFGARFDVAADGLVLLLLSVLVWLHDKAGIWVLAIGLLQYAFLAAGRVWPALARELPPSRRRKAVCVVQGVALTACLAPPVAPGHAIVIAGVALALLTASFVVDIVWLLRDRPAGASHASTDGSAP